METISIPQFGNIELMTEAPSISKIKKDVMQNGRVRILTAQEWQLHRWCDIRYLLHKIALYVIPTVELIEFLKEEIDGQKAIEICAGTGYVGRALGIVMTDSYQQRDDKATVEYYKCMGQPAIDYPADVLKLEASVAVRRIRPHTVVACYATHKWREDTQTGNYKGVDFVDVFGHCSKLILVGNKGAHKDNPLMSLPHREIKLEGLLTRSSIQSLNRIFIWER